MACVENRILDSPLQPLLFEHRAVNGFCPVSQPSDMRVKRGAEREGGSRILLSHLHKHLSFSSVVLLTPLHSEYTT
jgi:hypothetical protein